MGASGSFQRHAEKHLLTDEVLDKALPYCLVREQCEKNSSFNHNKSYEHTLKFYCELLFIDMYSKSAYYSTSGWRSLTLRTRAISSRCVLLQPCRQWAPTDLSWGLIYVPVMIMPAGDPYFINQMCSTHIPHHRQSCSDGRCKFWLTFFVSDQNYHSTSAKC